MTPAETPTGAQNRSFETTEVPVRNQGNKRNGIIVVGALIAFFLGVLFVTYQLGFGTLRQPGPGLWPFVVALAGLLLSVYTLLKKPDWAPSPIGTYKWTRFMMALVIGYGVALPVLGYLLATTGLCLGVTRIIGKMGWVSSGTTSVLTATLSYMVFNVALNVPAIESSLF